MRWENDPSSDNVQDDRGQSFGGGFGGPIAIGGGGLGLVVVVILALVFGVDPTSLLQGGQSPAPSYSTQAPPGPRADDEDARFAGVVLGYTEEVWGQVMAERGARYQPPTLVLYEQGHPTGCGFGQSAMGPFYCPADQRVYLDLGFFHELSARFGAPGRFAEAYVIAHEVGHHIQTLVGITERVEAERRRLDAAASNRLSVRTELQADCFAGVWAARINRTRQVLEPGDVQQGLAAASAVGDDTLQKQTQGRVAPDAFTHGSSAQRTHWFSKGFDVGEMEACDTFSQAYGSL